MSAADAQAWLVALGCLHFVQLPAMSLLVRGPLRLKPELAKLSPISHRIVLLFIWGLMLLLLGLGGLLVAESESAVRSSFGRGLSGLLAMFFGLRVLAQLWIYRIWPNGLRNRAMYYVFGSLYLFLATGYSLVAFS